MGMISFHILCPDIVDYKCDEKKLCFLCFNEYFSH